MTVHVLIPVFNRLPLTRLLINCLRRQVLSHSMRILVINDGSTDNTEDWLAKQADIEVLNGDGSLFWGGAIDLALQHLASTAEAEDWLLLMNNDTTVTEHFVQRLVETAVEHAPAIVGSVVRDEANHSQLLSIGVSIDTWRLLTVDILKSDRQKITDNVVKVDALSGRGALFPIKSLAKSGGMRPSFLPHYLADYDMSVRARKLGWKLLVSPDAAVYSKDDYGSRFRANSLRKRLFSVKSPSYLPALFVFWWEASNWKERFTLLPRFLLFFIFPRLRRLS